MNMKKLHMYLFYISLIAILSIPLITAPTAVADGADAELHEVEVTASPSSQGRGGIIIVDAAALFYGGCCYHLYANEVTANLTAPEGIEVIQGPTPQKYDEVDAQPGGTATVVHFKWSVRGNVNGRFNLSVVVETKNCGSVENEVVVEIVEGCIISYPDLYPKQLSVDKENILAVMASTSLEGRYVEEVTLFYVFGEEFSDGEPKNDTLYLVEGKKKVGNPIELEQDQFIPEEWMCKLETPSSGKINFWFVAEDDRGENTSSSLYSMDVIDQNRIDTINGVIFWGLIVGSLIGFILIFLIQDIHTKRKESKRNIVKLDTEFEGEEKVNRVREIIVVSVLIISLILIISALIFGFVQEIVELALG
ncbi:MAG: hypothetical protein JSV09_02255 [Thermoplasmata archaeon]|nr:MAG: hypothetical protein JSV09_02255 [Thermoplasmata archaeon]